VSGRSPVPPYRPPWLPCTTTHSRTHRHRPLPAQVILRPCRLVSTGDADMGRALSQLPRLTFLRLQGDRRAVLLNVERAEGCGWQVASRSFLTPDVAVVLARAFSGGAAPAGRQQQRQQPAAGASQQGSSFDVWVKIQPGPPSAQTSQLPSLGRALAAFDDVRLGLHCDGEACPATAHALLQPVAARLEAVRVTEVGGTASGVVEALGRLALPRLRTVALSASLPGCDPGAAAAVIGLDAPCLQQIAFGDAISGSRADVVAALAGLALGRPRPVGLDGRPANLHVGLCEAVVSDEELGSVRRAVSAAGRAGWVTVAKAAA
jgi:hypothetical protein